MRLCVVRLMLIVKPVVYHFAVNLRNLELFEKKILKFILVEENLPQGSLLTSENYRVISALSSV